MITEQPTATVPNVLSRQMPNRSGTVLAALVFLLTAQLPSPDADHPVTPLVDARYLPNFHQVHSYLYRGASPSYEGLLRLKQLGVKSVIDLRQDESHIRWERAYTKQLGLNYISLPMGDFVPSADKRELFFRTVQAAATDSAQGPVFVHCSHGSDRTGFLVGLWRFCHDHWSVAASVGEMLRYGFIVHKWLPDSRTASGTKPNYDQ